MSPLRAPAIGFLRRATMTAPPQLARSIGAAHIYPSSFVRIQDGTGGVWRYSRPPARCLSVTVPRRAAHDSSAIDVVHTPSVKHEEPHLPEITRIPLLPDNDSPPPGREIPDASAIRPLARPEISTVSGDGTHLDVPSAMSEVTDNHAADLDPYDLTKKVAVAASNATRKAKEPGWVKTLWTGLLDDLLGRKTSPKA